MSDAFTDVAKMRKIKAAIEAHEGELVEMTLENGRKRQKNKVGRLIEVYPSLFIVEYEQDGSSYVESYTYSDILTEKNLIRYFDEEDSEDVSQETLDESDHEEEEV